MQKIILATALAAAVSASLADTTCPEAAAYFDRLTAAGIRQSDLGRFESQARALCARSGQPAPKSAEEYHQAQQIGHQRRLQEMKATPETTKIRLWN